MKAIINPSGLPLPPFPYAHAVRCGEWIFASGQLAADFASGMDPAAQNRPGSTQTTIPVKSQLRVIYRNLSQLLEHSGSSLQSMSRSVSFFTRRQDVHPASEVIEEQLERRPTSAGLVVSRLMAPDALIQIDPIAMIESDERRLEPFDIPDRPNVSRSFSRAITFGQWVFVAGSTAGDHVPHDALGGSSLEVPARVDPNYWLGSAIKRQVNYIMRERFEPLLRAAGSDLRDVVRAQVYLTDMAQDFAPFLEAWGELFPERAPSTVVMPINSLGVVFARVEISLIALRQADALVTRVEAPAVANWAGNIPQAVRAGELIWFSTIAAIDDGGLLEPAGENGAFPFFDSPGRRQMSAVFTSLSEILRAAGSDLSRLLKLTVFTSDLQQLPGYIEVWRDALGESPCALTVVEVNGPFAAPNCTVAVDAVAAAD